MSFNQTILNLHVIYFAIVSWYLQKETFSFRWMSSVLTMKCGGCDWSRLSSGLGKIIWNGQDSTLNFKNCYKIY